MLLLTDRPDKAQELKRLMWAVEPCIVVSPGEAADVRGHSMILSDLALSSANQIALARTTLSSFLSIDRVPVLHLSRQDDNDALAQAQAIKATAFLPRKASQAQIIFAAKGLIRAAQIERDKLRAREQGLVKAKFEEAGLALEGIFDASRRGAPVDPEDLDRGTSAIIATVAGRQANMWLDLVRAHDDVTYQHCLLVTGLVAAFSASFGMTPKSQRQIVTAALLHDIGKAKIPLEILNKKGRLSDPEMAVIRTHPGIGHDILVRQGGLDPQVLDIVRHHHEFLDGSGYPDGLQGDAISPLVRLVTICDIYGALIERRSYKEPMASNEAISILSNMNAKLDRGLLASFISQAVKH